MSSSSSPRDCGDVQAAKRSISAHSTRAKRAAEANPARTFRETPAAPTGTEAAAAMGSRGATGSRVATGNLVAAAAAEPRNPTVLPVARGKVVQVEARAMARRAAEDQPEAR